MLDKQLVKFGDICREVKLSTKNPFVDGYDRFIGLEHLDSGSLKIKRWGVISDDNPSFTRVFKKGHLLFGKRRPYLKKAAIAEFDGICSSDIIVIEPKNEMLRTDFFPYIFLYESIWNKAINTSSGSLSPRTKFKSLESLTLSLPASNRQKKLAYILGGITRNQSIIEELLSALKRVKKCIVEKFNRGEYSNSKIFKESLIGRIPSNWEAKTLGSLFNNKDNLRIPVKSSDRSKIQGNIPYYGASGIIDYVDKVIFNEDLLLLSEDGANLVERKTPVAFKVSGPCFVNNHAHVYGDKGIYEIELAVELIENMDLSNYITGTAQPKLNKAKADGIFLPVPPENERKIILEQLGNINNLIVLLGKHQLKHGNLLKSIINRELS